MLSKNIKISFLLCGIFLLKITCYAQDEKKHFTPLLDKTGWEVSGNFGIYFPSKYQAEFYSGKGINENNFNYVWSNKYWKQEIINLLVENVNRDSVIKIYFPEDMKYDPAMYVGFSARYNFSSQLALNTHFNFVKLKTKSIISLEVYPPYTGQVQSFEYCGLYGDEQRTNINIGLMYTLHPEKQITPFAEFGININNTKVNKHVMRLYDREFNLVNIYGNSSYIPGVPLNEYDIRQGGIGYGIFASPGIRYVMNSQFSMELALDAYLKTINLPGYNKRLNLHTAGIFRLVFSPLFSFGEQENKDK